MSVGCADAVGEEGLSAAVHLALVAAAFDRTLRSTPCLRWLPKLVRT